MTKESEDINRIGGLIGSNDPITKRKFDLFKEFVHCETNEELLRYNFMIDLYDDFVPKLPDIISTKESETPWIAAREAQPTSRDIILKQRSVTGFSTSHGEMSKHALEQIQFPPDVQLAKQFVGRFFRSAAGGLPRIIVKIEFNPGDHFSRMVPYYETKTRVAYESELPDPKSELWYDNYKKRFEEEE